MIGWGVLARLGSWLLPGGGFLAGIVSLAGAIFDELAKCFRACLLNPRVFIIIGMVGYGTYVYGRHGGYAQGAADFEAWKQTSIRWEKEASANADRAVAAGKAARVAEEAKIAAERKAAGVKPVIIRKAAPRPKPDWFSATFGG